MAVSELASFRRFIVGTIDALVGALAGPAGDELDWRPQAPATNSLDAIAMHVLGNAEDNLLGTLCGQAIVRDRPAEFAARGTSAGDVRARWAALRRQVDVAFAALPPGDLGRERRHPRRGALSGRESLLVVARHAAEHWGEAQLTRSLLQAARTGTGTYSVERNRCHG